MATKVECNVNTPRIARSDVDGGVSFTPKCVLSSLQLEGQLAISPIGFLRAHITQHALIQREHGKKKSTSSREFTSNCQNKGKTNITSVNRALGHHEPPELLH